MIGVTGVLVAVGSTGVFVGGTGVFVGGTGVLVGGTGVFVGGGVRMITKSARTDPPDGTFTVCDWVTPLYDAVTVTDPDGTHEKL